MACIYSHSINGFIGNKLILSFEGVESNIYVWLNGKFIGYSEDSFTPSRFDITKYTQEKDNVLCVRIFQKCTGTWLEDQDMWRFSGIFRDVMIYKQPSQHIQDLKIDTNIDLDTKKSILTCTCKMSSNENHILQAKLYDPQGNIVWNANMQDTFEIPVENTSLWSSEYPNLYQLEIVLYDANNEIIETIQEQVGFRKFTLEYGIMKLNGKRIVFHGINRHEWNAKTGRDITYEQMEEDIHMLKALNINAVRTSHYPNNSYWYKLCDQYGIYVIDEMNLETHGANDVLPGLTGWAQVNGRDELEIDVKANLDGEYCKNLSFLFDVKCFLMTIFSVLKHDGVVEGGTGSIHNKDNN